MNTPQQPPPPPPMTDEEFARELQKAEEEQQQQQQQSARASSDGVTDMTAFLSEDERADEEYARLLQATELTIANANARRDRAAEDGGVGGGGGGFEDPIFGKMPSLRSGETTHPPHRILLFALCPCFVDPFAEDKKKILVSLLRTSSAVAMTLACTFYFLLSIAIGGFAPTSENPMLGPPAATMVRMGAKDTYRIVHRFQIHRLVVPIFMHAGFVHLFTNMFILFRIGVLLEKEWGVRNFLVIYLAGGVIATLSSCIALTDYVGVGASGALLALMGAWLAQILCTWGVGIGTAAGRLEQEKRVFSLIVLFVNVSVTFSFSMVPYIDWASHLGGFVAGFLIGLLLFLHHIEPPPRRSFVLRAAAGSLAALVILQLIITFFFLHPLHVQYQ